MTSALTTIIGGTRIELTEGNRKSEIICRKLIDLGIECIDADDQNILLQISNPIQQEKFMCICVEHGIDFVKDESRYHNAFLIAKNSII